MDVYSIRSNTFIMQFTRFFSLKFSTMKSSRFFLLLVLSCICLLSCKKKDNPPADNYSQDLQYSLDTTWQNFTAQLPNYQGGLGVYIVSPKGTWFVSSGLDAGASAGSHFRAASITKSFTAAAIMLLDQQGKLNIDDTVTDLIPGTAMPYLPDDTSYQIPYKNRITIRQLLEHRANIFDQVNSPIPYTVSAWYAGQFYSMAIVMQVDRYHQFTLDEMARLISRHQLTYGEPGIEHRYSNGGYTLLAKIIERVSGKPYHEFVTDELLVSNQLNETSLPYLGSDTALPTPFLHGYLYQSSTAVDITMFNMSCAIGEGNVISSFRDLVTFYRNLFTGKAGLNPTQVSRMMECPVSNESYGLGIKYIEGLGYGHTGSQLGYLAVAVYDPTNDCMIISESTLYPQDQQANKALGKEVVELLKSMKQTLGY